MTQRVQARRPTRAAKEILDVLLESPAAQREQLIEELCGHSPALQAEVEWLLSYDESLGGFLDEPVARVPLSLGTADEAPPSIRSYRIVRGLGRGGMGTVYLAERAEVDFEQRVALKVLRDELAAEDGERLRRERQILARLQHPHIARLIDGGLTDDGRPFLAMEYVDGSSITDYSERHGLSVEERLQLFLDLCNAVQYAHQNMVLHRDLKPSNVLVSKTGELKLLDFGIAKWLAPSPASDGSAPTERALTPDFASPEQLRGDSVTALTDVYSLGVLLYRLLTGRLPFDRRGLAPGELARQLEVEQAVAPSEALALAEDGTPSDRRTIRGDLDIITLKALSLEPCRRYSSAAALADDLRRFLTHEPIEARTAGWAYSVARLVQRHRAAAVLTLLLVLGLGAFGAVSFSLSLRLRSERDSSLRAQSRAEKVKELLVEALRSANPLGTSEPAETVEQLLEGLARRVEVELGNQPRLRAELLHTLGTTFDGLGRPEKALPLLERALETKREVYGDRHPEAAATLQAIGEVWTEKGDFREARQTLKKALEILAGHPDAAPREIVSCQVALGWVAFKEGKIDQGERFAREALERAEAEGEDLVTADALDLLGTVIHRRGDEAEGILRRGLELRLRAQGEFSPALASSLNNLALLYQEQGRLTEAEQHYREALEVRRRVFRPGHPHIVHSLSNLGSLLHAAGPLEVAERILSEALDGARQTLGDRHLFTALSRNNLAAVAAERGKFGWAESLGRENVRALEEIMGKEHYYVSLGRNNLGWYLIEQGRLDEAEPLERRALAELEVARGEDSAEVAQVRNNLGVLYLRRGQETEAARELERVLELRSQVYPEDHPDIARTRTYLAIAWTELGHFDQAKAAAEAALRGYASSLDADDWRVAEASAALGGAVSGTGDSAGASRLLDQAVQRLERTRAWAWETRWARGLLAALETDRS